ncbi:PAS domain-containing protein [Candidatus Microgenomates bacterium]|nr:MAG: PAS domain-containing protein [Candidatus Microgenomates bacterium]
MFLPILSVLTVIIFGTIAVIISVKEEKTRKKLLEEERKHKQRLYEILVLKEIQERIGYELDFEKIIDFITGSIRNFFPYSTASSLVIKENKLILKTFVEEEINHAFLEKIKNAMLASFKELLEEPLPVKIEESFSGAIINDGNTKTLASFFHIPLNLNNKVMGLISIASTKPGLYKEDEMTILYQLINQASQALLRLERVLSTEKGKLMAMIGSLADGVFMVDTNKQLLVMNEAAKNLLKIQKENPTILDIASSTAHAFNLPEKIEQTISQGKRIEEKEVKLGNKYVQIFITPVTGGNTIIGASILLQDITLEKNLLKMKEDFTNIVIHELRAPLSAIKSASELMSDPEKLSREEQLKFLTLIDEQTKKLLEQVALLLDASKIEAGKFEINKQVSDIKKVILQSVEVFIPSAQRKQITIETNLNEEFPPMLFDPLRISQVINNLISNSLKFTPENGKISISAKLEKKELGERETHGTGERQDPSQIRISVSDTGIGIPKEKQQLLFLKFSQINSPSENEDLLEKHKKFTMGTGLGLYIIKVIVEAHGGSVSLESEPDKGTVVSFTLPL